MKKKQGFTDIEGAIGDALARALMHAGGQETLIELDEHVQARVIKTPEIEYTLMTISGESGPRSCAKFNLPRS